MQSGSTNNVTIVKGCVLPLMYNAISWYKLLSKLIVD